MKVLKFKGPAAESDVAIYRRLALAFQSFNVWPLHPYRVASFTIAGETYRFYVLVPKGRS